MNTTRRGFLAHAAAAVGVGGLMAKSVAADDAVIPSCSGGKLDSVILFDDAIHPVVYPPAWGATITVGGHPVERMFRMRKQTDSDYRDVMMFFLRSCITDSVPKVLSVALRDHIMETWLTTPFKLKDDVVVREWSGRWRVQTEYLGGLIVTKPESHKIVVTERRNRDMVLGAMSRC